MGVFPAVPYSVVVLEGAAIGLEPRGWSRCAPVCPYDYARMSREWYAVGLCSPWRPMVAVMMKERPVQDGPVTQQAWVLQRSITRAQISVDQLWAHYISLGGDAGRFDVDAYLNRAAHLPRFQRDLLDYAARELMTDQ